VVAPLWDLPPLVKWTIAIVAGGGAAALAQGASSLLRVKSTLATGGAGNVLVSTGELGGADFEEIYYEGYGPDGVAILVHAMTDNRNRTAAEARLIFSKNAGSIGEPGSVAWQFDKQG